MTTYTIKQSGSKYQVTIHMEGKKPIVAGFYSQLKGAHSVGKMLTELDNKMIARQEEYASR